MPIKKRLLVCDCSKEYAEDNDHKIEGEVLTGPWSVVKNEAKKDDSDSESVLLNFKRVIHCIDCKSPILEEVNHISVNLVKPNFFESCSEIQIVWKK